MEPNVNRTVVKQSPKNDGEVQCATKHSTDKYIHVCNYHIYACCCQMA